VRKAVGEIKCYADRFVSERVGFGGGSFTLDKASKVDDHYYHHPTTTTGKRLRQRSVKQ
jgi:hypothetical protein